MYLPPDCHPHLPKRASAAVGAGSGIAAGGVAAKNSGGDERSTRFILGFGIGVPVLLLLIGCVWYLRRRRARKAASENKKGSRKNCGRQRKRKRWGGFGWPERLKPVPAPPAHRKSDKNILPSML